MLLLRPTVSLLLILSLWAMLVVWFFRASELTFFRPVHADILSDLAAALAGSIGIAPSSNLDPSRQYPSMFEPIHGSAPDIAGKGIANPVGAFWSAAEMVRWVGAGKLDAQADALMQAIENVTGAGIKTKDLGGDKGTEEVTQAVVEEIERLVKKK
jgi:isocitrate/isopropylmalate dehydrogenase